MPRPRPDNMRRWLALTLLVGLGACVDAPELDRAVPGWVDDAPYPELIPLGPDILTAVPPEDQSQEIGDRLTARADGLKTRAGRLQAAPVLDEETRKRMAEGVSR